MRSFIYYLAEISLDDHNLAQPAGAMRAAMFQSFVEADVIMRRSERLMTVEERRELADSMTRALTAYSALSTVFSEQLLYHAVPKLHMAEHMTRDFPMNPRASSCYQDEDMVGRCKNIYSSTHGLTAALRSLQRYCLIVSLRWQHEINNLRA